MIHRIEIRKSRAKQPFSVHYFSKKKIGKGKYELLSRSENLPTKANCITNIKSMGSIYLPKIKLVENTVSVLDLTGKQPKIIEVKY